MTPTYYPRRDWRLWLGWRYLAYWLPIVVAVWTWAMIEFYGR